MGIKACCAEESTLSQSDKQAIYSKPISREIIKKRKTLAEANSKPIENLCWNSNPMLHKKKLKQHSPNLNKEESPSSCSNTSPD